MGYKSQAYENQAKSIIKNLEKRNMKGYYCETGAKALELVRSILPKGAVVTNGGSETLVETGIMDLIRRDDYEYIDRKSAKTPEESRALYGRIVTADYFLMSTNAITREGELINVDGVGNRVACLINGPEHVLVIAGMNKVVPTLEDGIRRGAKGLLKEVELFDIYTGAPIPEGKKSVAFNLTLRADDRSLTAAEADEDVKSVLELLEKELGAVLR